MKEVDRDSTEEQKAHILRMIPLGVDLYTACIQARLTFDQIDSLEKDDDFQMELEYALKREEMRLMELYCNTVENAATFKYDYKGLRERLEMLNPGRYSRKAIDARVGNPLSDDEGAIKVFNLPSNGRVKE